MATLEATVEYAKSLGWRVKRIKLYDSTADDDQIPGTYFILYRPGETREGVMGSSEEGLWLGAFENGELPVPPETK